MTPRQFDLLCARHRATLMHRELIGAYTTAAVINHSMLRPEDPVSPTAFMPNHDDSEFSAGQRDWDEETLQRISDYSIRVAEEAARQRKAADERGERVSGNCG